MTKYNNCKFCLKPVELIPSAEERAKRFGGTAEEHRNKFNSHAVCEIRNKSRRERDLLREKHNISEV